MIAKVASVVVVVGVAAVGSGAYAQPPRDYQGDCTRAGCHEDQGTRAFMHGPVTDGSCDACHQKVAGDRHKFEFAAAREKLCLECHDEFEGRVQHAPVVGGQCTACHDPHGSPVGNFLRAPTADKLCEKCHEKVSDREYLHGPVATGACVICHDPHASGHSALLVAENRDVCVMCHTAIEARITSQTVQHAPVMEECTACHDAHGAANRMNLKATSPGLCVDCHDGIGDILDEAAVKHDAVTAGKSCLGCHEPHAGNVERLLLREPMDLCLSCHDKELTSGDGKIINIAKLLTENPSHHGPIRQKNCTACHPGVHGGEHFRLLLGEYPPGFYAPFEEQRYAFCFNCHESDLVRDERTDTLTNFRNGNWNQHYVHVNRKVKGRTCRACHATHASRRPRHITETVPFGSWELPVNHDKTPTGGSCLPGCHKRYQYDRNTPVNNLPGDSTK